MSPYDFTDKLNRKPSLTHKLPDGSFYLAYIKPEIQATETVSDSDPIYLIEKVTKTTDSEGEYFRREVANGSYCYNVAWTDRATVTYKMR